MSPPSGFWLQQASRAATEVVALADDLATRPAGRPGIVLGPVNAPAKLRDLYAHARPQGDVVADPCGFLLDREPTKRAKDHYPWLVQTPHPSTKAQWEGWMRAGLDHQLSPALLGQHLPPSFLITPCPQLVAADGPSGLYPVLDAATTVRSEPDEECWLGINVDRDYLRAEEHLVRLANSLVASDTPGVVLRCFQSQMPPVDDLGLLEGLREITESCTANGKKVLLPNAGWLGWLAMGWGAWGFSGGMAKSTWYDRMPTPMTNVPRYDSIFESQLLRHVRWPVHVALTAEQGYQPCWCSSCAAMAGSYDTHEAATHQIRVAHEEAATLRTLTGAQRRQVVAQRLDNAIAFREGLPLVLRGRTQAEFLSRWRAFL